MDTAGPQESTPPQRRELVLRPPRIGDIGWVIQRHAVLYAQEYGWNREFEALVAEIGAGLIRSFDPASEAGWIAEVDGVPAGSAFVVREDALTAKLRLVLVEPEARGLGLGRRLVDEALAFARGAGYTHMVLWTHDVLVAARRLYERSGFTRVSQEPHHRFGVDLVGQVWRRPL